MTGFDFLQLCFSLDSASNETLFSSLSTHPAPRVVLFMLHKIRQFWLLEGAEMSQVLGIKKLKKKKKK